MADHFNASGTGLLGLFNLFSGGALQNISIFALGIMPYISASIFVQIAGAVLPSVDKMQKDEEGRKKLTQYTRYITVALALVQAQSLEVALWLGLAAQYWPACGCSACKRGREWRKVGRMRMQKKEHNDE